MGNIVKLVFQAIATGSGFGKLLGEVKGLNEKMPGLSKAAQIVGMSFGTAGAAAGRMVSMLLQGSIWGVAAEGAKLLIDKLGLFKDKTAETKEELDKLEESTRKFYETVNSNSQKSIAKIDAETKRRNEQLDITNRMIKAELQLQKAKAISSGDTKGAESIDRQMADVDSSTAMQKAENAARSQARTLDEKESKLADMRIAELKARRDLAKAEEAYRKKTSQASMSIDATSGAFVDYTPDTSSEKAAVESARKRLDIAREQRAAAADEVAKERDRYELALENVKALKAEQEAADAERRAKGTAAAKKELDEQVKAITEKQEAERKASEEHAEKERARIAKEKELKRQQMMKELQEEVRQNNERRKKELQKDIEANRMRADDLRQRLTDAKAAADAARDVLGNAAGMDQAGALSEKRRAALTDDRYTKASINLVASGKIRKGADGKWENATRWRLSNFNQAVMDRMNAEAEKRKLEGENDKVVKKLDDLIKKLEELTSL